MIAFTFLGAASFSGREIRPFLMSAPGGISASLDRLLSDLGPAFENMSQIAGVYLETAKELFSPVVNAFEVTRTRLAPLLARASDAAGTAVVAAVVVAGSLLILLVLYWIVKHCTRAGPGAKQPQAIVRHILVKEEEHALFLRTELSGIKPGNRLLDKFASFATKHSECNSGVVGGALGTIEPGKMAPAFDRVVWSAPLMTLQGPVQTDDGYHLILILQRSGELPSDEKAKKDS